MLCFDPQCRVRASHSMPRLSGCAFAPISLCMRHSMTRCSTGYPGAEQVRRSLGSGVSDDLHTTAQLPCNCRQSIAARLELKVKSWGPMIKYVSYSSGFSQFGLWSGMYHETCSCRVWSFASDLLAIAIAMLPRKTVVGTETVIHLRYKSIDLMPASMFCWFSDGRFEPERGRTAAFAFAKVKALTGYKFASFPTIQVRACARRSI